MEEKYTRKVTKEVDEECGLKVVCDKCGKVIADYDDKTDDLGYIGLKTIPLFTLTTGHYDWGNDSCDSVKYRHLCCETCVASVLSDYFEDSKRSDTAYFELSRALVVKNINWKTGEFHYYVK